MFLIRILSITFAAFWVFVPGFARANNLASMNKSESVIGNTVSNYRLTGADGKRVQFFSFKGKPVILSFMFTECTEACPMITNNISVLLKKFPKEMLKDFRVVSISMDTVKDSVDKLASFSKQYRDEFPNWGFYVVDEPTLKLLSEETGFTFERIAGTIDHLNRVTVLNADGVIAGHAYGVNFDKEGMEGAIKELTVPNTFKSVISSLYFKAYVLFSTYDPASKIYKPDIRLIVLGAILIILILSAVIFLPIFYFRRKAKAAKATVLGY
jgi:protein SCO1/2